MNRAETDSKITYLKPNIKNQALKNKAMVRLEKLWEITKCNWTNDLQFEFQTKKTTRHFYKAIDELKAFIDNID